MKYLVVWLLVASCLAREESQDKALSGGRDKTSAELEKDKERLAKEQKQERNNAKKTFNKRCGSVLKGGKWKKDGTASDGFFVYRTKSLACDDEQLVLIDVDAAHFMNSHYISCTKSDDKRLLLEIPKSPVATNRQIRVDCQTKVFDIGFDDGELLIATIERNGSTHRVTIDQNGQWQGGITELATGIGTHELNALHKQAEELRRAGTLGRKIEKMVESAVKGAVIGAGVGMTLVLGDELLNKGKRSTKAHVGVVTGFAIAGGLVVMGLDSNNLDNEEEIEAAALTIVRSYARRKQSS